MNIAVRSLHAYERRAVSSPLGHDRSVSAASFIIEKGDWVHSANLEAQHRRNL